MDSSEVPQSVRSASILMVALILLSGLFLVFALVQRVEANRQRDIVVKLKAEAVLVIDNLKLELEEKKKLIYQKDSIIEGCCKTEK